MLSRSPLQILAAVAALSLAACDQVETRASELGTKAEGALDDADAALAEAGAQLDAEVDRLQDLFRGTREDALATLEQRLEGWRGDLDDLAADVRERGGTDAERLLEDLSRARTDAEAKLADLRAAGEDSWRDLCRDLERESADVESRLRELVERWQDRER